MDVGPGGVDALIVLADGSARVYDAAGILTATIAFTRLALP